MNSLSVHAWSVLLFALAPAVGATGAADARLPLTAQEPTTDALAVADDPGLLVLRSGIFDPSIARLDFRATGVGEQADSRYAILQFHPGQLEARTRLEKLGVEFLAYLPHNAYQVRLGASNLETLRADPALRYAGALEAGMKVAPELWADALARANARNQPITELEIRLFGGESAERLARAVRKLDPATEVIDSAEREQGARMRVRLTAGVEALVFALAQIEGIAWIAPHIEPRVLNDGAVGPMQGNAASGSPIWDRDIIGSGQIVAVADSGLDRNEDWFVHYDSGAGPNTVITNADSPIPPALGTTFPANKVFAYWVQPGATSYDSNAACPGGTPISFHGTHVSGTVAGDRLTTATPTNPNHDGSDGMAPNAQLLFQDIGHDTSGCLSGLSDLRGTLQQAHAGGARIHSNSWGSPTAGAYSGNDADVDQSLFGLENMLVAIAAGNSGSGGNTIGSPGVSKNALTVGALGADNSTTTALFSSRGQTDDGRTKPDIMAPGSSVTSAAGDSNNSPAVETGATSTKDGTSMATPTVAGSSALLRQYFSDGYYPRGAKTAADAHHPNGTLMKALLLNGTNPLTTWPSTATGWGRLWLESNLYFNSGVGGVGPGDVRRMRFWQRENATGLATGDLHTYSLNVQAGQELRVTLTWYDPEGALGSAINLVNNLDLEVVAPNATAYRGNVLSGGVSTAGGSFDARNTVEHVRFTAPAAGAYTLRVRGGIIPGNGQANTARQGYSLVASGAFGLPDVAPAAAPASPSIVGNGVTGVDVGFAPVAGSSGYQLYRATGTCAAAPAGEFRMVATGAASPLKDDRSQGGYAYAYKVRAIANDVEGEVSACIGATSADTCTLQPTFSDTSASRDYTNASCQVGLSWAAGSSLCPAAPAVTYDVERSNSAYFNAPVTVASNLAATTFNDAPVTFGQPYYYRITAIDAAGNRTTGARVLNATPVGAGGPSGENFVDDVDTRTFANLATPWRITNTAASQGTLSYHNAADGQTYLADTCADLTLPALTIPSGASLRYSARYAFEAPSAGDDGWDGVVVQISTDGGTNWTAITPDQGYPGDFGSTGSPPINACGFAATQRGFTTTSGGAFLNYTHNLGAYAGQSVLIRFRFSSDPGSEAEGFFLDNLRIGNPDTIYRNGFETAAEVCN